MYWYFLMVVVLMMAVASIFLLRAKNPIAPTPEPRPNPFDGDTHLPYTSRPIMTQTELQVYDKLLQALPNHMIFAQVQVSRIIESPEEDNLYWFNFINRLSYDFVICRTDGTPLAAIEIDDDTHELTERQEADTRKNLATRAANIEILRWDIREIPTIRNIARTIREIDDQRAK